MLSTLLNSSQLIFPLFYKFHSFRAPKITESYSLLTLSIFEEHSDIAVRLRVLLVATTSKAIRTRPNSLDGTRR